MNVNIAEIHKPLIQKIADYSIENEMTDDFVVNTITSASLMENPSKHLDRGAIELFKSFGSLVDLSNLCYLIENHYTLEAVCKAIINYRITGEL